MPSPLIEPQVPRIVRKVTLPRVPYWGDLIADPRGDRIGIAIREKSAGLCWVDRDGATAVQMVQVPYAQPRLRAIDSAGEWYLTTPDEPQAVIAIDPSDGHELRSYTFRGRFDPDTRLVLRPLAAGQLLLAGGGVPGLQLLDADDGVVTDYYAFHERHRQDFAWRGISAVARRPSDGLLALCDRFMFGTVLLVDPAAGHLRDLAARASLTMGADGALREPAWVEWAVDGTLLVLELESRTLSRWSAEGVRVQSWRLTTAPWHYLAAEQFVVSAMGSVAYVAQDSAGTHLCEVTLD